MFTFYFQKDQTRKSNRNSICSTFPCKQIDVPAKQLLILQHGENGVFFFTNTYFKLLPIIPVYLLMKTIVLIPVNKQLMQGLYKDIVLWFFITNKTTIVLKCDTCDTKCNYI